MGSVHRKIERRTERFDSPHDMIIRFVFWPIVFVCQLIFLTLLSWHLMAQIDFAYPLGYKLLQLDASIATHAAENVQKNDFEATSTAEHWTLFSQIVNSIQSSGTGLREISYTSRNGSPAALLNEKEIIHLQDVANIVEKLYATGLVALALWTALIFSARLRGVKPPSTKEILTGFACGTILAVVIVFSIGPKRIFYWFHTVAFPDGHQWYFYYHESLMAALMKAPDIFAYIAVLLLACIVFFWCLSLYILKILLRRR